MERQKEAGLSGKVAIVTGSSRGIGKESGTAGLEEFLESKSLAIPVG